MNEGYVYRERIDRRGAGQRLDTYLARRYPHTSLAGWGDHVAAGRVRIDDRASTVETLLVAGQELAWHRPPWQEPDAPLDLPVLFSRDDLLVVHKPAGLPTLPGGGFLQNTLLHRVRLAVPTASPLHRLGRWTSGALLCATTPAAGRAIADQFAARAVHKRYRAWALGTPDADAFDVDVPIGPVQHRALGTVHAASPAGRRASSSVRVVEQRSDSFLCDVTIATGRPHQIRIHLAAAGHPLVGDPLYGVGGLPRDEDALPGDAGYHLHAAELGFTSPGSGAPVRVVAPLPPALRTRGEDA